jgi:hypothetical protein
VSIHTPDVCYRAGGFEVASPIKVTIAGESEGSAAEFVLADLSKKTAVQQIRQRIFWSWSCDGQWQVPDNPRGQFASRPVLFKLYVLRDSNAAGEPVDDDPCADFLRRFLPQVRKTLFSRS